MNKHLETTLLSIRLSHRLKERFAAVCKENETDVSTALRTFMQKEVKKFEKKGIAQS